MVNIDKVYQRVLFLANKEQRGYITPAEFNSYAELAQLEIFESYFLKKFQANQAPPTTDDYSDVAMNVEEKITFFDNTIEVPNRGPVANTVAGYSSGAFVSTSSNAYRYPDGFYRLSQVVVNNRMADEVSHKDLTYINLSPLTAPTVSQPVFTRHEGGVVVYPTSYTGAITMIYVRKPSQPKWGYVNPSADQIAMGVPNTPMYDSRPLSDNNYDQNAFSVDFELHPSDEQELTYKILTLAGITIKQPDVAGFGQGKEQQIAATEG